MYESCGRRAGRSAAGGTRECRDTAEDRQCPVAAGIRISCEHLVPFEPVNTNTILSSWSEFACGDDVHIPPEPVLWIVWEVHTRGEGVAEVGTGGIACLGDRNTVVEGRSARGELR